VLLQPSIRPLARVISITPLARLLMLQLFPVDASPKPMLLCCHNKVPPFARLRLPRSSLTSGPVRIAVLPAKRRVVPFSFLMPPIHVKLLTTSRVPDAHAASTTIVREPTGKRRKLGAENSKKRGNESLKS